MCARPLKRKLAAVLHTDVKGYSRLMSINEEETVHRLNENRRLLEKLVEAYGGRMVDTAGDGFLVDFPSVVDAVGCAVEFQREMRRRNEQAPEDMAMEFRVGVNVGDVIEDGDNIFGDGVNIAARLQALSEPGGIYVSGAAYDHLRRKLALGYEFLGEQSVKNIIDPVRIYRVHADAGFGDTDKDEPKAQGEPSKNRSRIVAAVLGVTGIATLAILILIYAVGLKPRTIQPAEKKATAPIAEPSAADNHSSVGAVPSEPSVAVLPLRYMGASKSEFPAKGVTAEIIHRLSATPSLLVMAPATVFSFKEEDPSPDVVRRGLNVRYVVKGELGRKNDRIEATLRIFGADTDAHAKIAEKRYDVSLKDAVKLPDVMARDILSVLGVPGRKGESVGTDIKPPTESWDAYEKYLKARQLTALRERHAVSQARALLDEAVAIDPRFGSAYASLARTYIIDARNGWAEFPP